MNPRPTLTLKKKPPVFPNGKKPREVADFLRVRFPLCFTDPPRPLQVGIKDAVLAALESESLDKRQRAAIGHALRYMTHSLSYLKALAAGDQPRVDLDGQPCELPTDAHRENARAMRAAIKDNLRTQRKAAADIERVRAAIPKQSKATATV